jgi:hypothetical protein
LVLLCTVLFPHSYGFCIPAWIHRMRINNMWYNKVKSFEKLCIIWHEGEQFITSPKWNMKIMKNITAHYLKSALWIQYYNDDDDNACPAPILCTNSSNGCSGRSVGTAPNYFHWRNKLNKCIRIKCFTTPWKNQHVSIVLWLF